MSPKNIAATVLKNHPELKALGSKKLRLVKQALTEAALLSSGEFLSPDESDLVFSSLIKDVGEPSAALRAYRNRLDLTQRELSIKSDIPQPHIAAMESGKRSIGLIAAKKLALALGINYKKLV